MDSYDRWKTTPPWDTEENARLDDALADAGWCDKHIAPRIDEMLKAGRFLRWLGAGVYEDDPCIDLYDWICEGVAEVLDELEGDILDDFIYRVGDDVQVNLTDISAVYELRVEVGDDVLEYIV